MAAIQAVKSVPKKTFAVMADGVFAGLAQENASMNQCLADPVVIANIRKLETITGSRESELDLPATIAANV